MVHRDVDAMGGPPVHAVEDDAFAVPIDVQDCFSRDTPPPVPD